MKLIDLRRVNSFLYNHPSKVQDKEIYAGFKKVGPTYFNSIEGEFGFGFESKSDARILVVRDWLGEIPLHYLVIKDCFYLANFVEDLLGLPGAEYENIRAVNRSEFVLVETKTAKISHNLYFNFNSYPLNEKYLDLQGVALQVHNLLQESTLRRWKSCDPKHTALILSGGIDSMSIAYLLSQIDKNIPVYTLQIAGQSSTDLTRAIAIAKSFGLKHQTINISKAEILKSLPKAIRESEIYHLYNVFCAVGMHLLAQKLADKGIRSVFTGEGGNEAFGDYHDWIVQDKILQKTDRILEQPIGREAYVWGNLKAEAIGRYNKQLGSGLGKHGGSRMYKPMQKHGISLLSPYLEKEILKLLANIPTKKLQQIGGKPGFMSMVFGSEIADGKIPASFFEISKIRFQDASEAGEGGITQTLLAAGFDQEKVIELFNQIFGAKIVGRAHLKITKLYS